MADRKPRTGFRTLREGIIAIALVLFCFLILMTVLNMLFPTGTGLNLLLGEQDEKNRPGGPSSREMLFQRGEDTVSFEGDYSWAAVLEKTDHRVKSKRGDAIAWQPARIGMRLYDQDAVQTLEKASALIRFDQSNVIDLEENSLIVIRRMERDLLFKEKRSYMVMVDGTLRGRLNAADENGVYLEVALPNATTRLQAQPESGESVEFRIDVGQDSGSLVTIFSGEATVEANGESVLLGRNQATHIEGSQAPSTPIDLPNPVTLQSPDNGKLFSYRSLPPRVSMTWQPPGGGDRYRLLLARDPEFSSMVLEEVVTRPRFVHGNLTPGRYWWKVSALQERVEGPFSPARSFRLNRDQEPPPLELQLPEVAETPLLQLEGITEPGARLFVSGEPISIGTEGGFRHPLQLQPGMNVVVVEAVDAAGNVTYRSQLIQGKF